MTILTVFVLILTFGFHEPSEAQTEESSCPPDVYHSQIDYVASFLKVEVIASDDKLLTIHLNNTGARDLLTCTWEIYFSMIVYPLQPRFTSSVFNVSHVNGFLFKLIPIRLYDNDVLIPQGGSESVLVHGRMPTKFFAFPNWIVHSVNSTARVIVSTNFDNQADMVRINSTVTSTQRFEANDKLKRPLPWSSGPKLVVPTPSDIQGEGPDMKYLAISGNWTVGVNSPRLNFEAELLQKFFGLEMKVTQSPGSQMIFLEVDLDVPNNTRSGLEVPEGYQLTTMGDRVLLTASSITGIFYGVQTIMSLSRGSMSNSNVPKTSGTPKMAAVNVTDYPKYKYRGVMIDTARHFLSVDRVKKLITVMSAYKMNHLHIHLADDEGFRIEIPELPELTRIGAQPSLKFDVDPKFDFLHPYVGQLPGVRQFYTREEYAEILRHASLHHVTVIPEVDFPGHSHASLVSMRVRKKFYRDQGKFEEADKFDIEDEKDTSDDSSVNNVADTVINVCKNSSDLFMRTIAKAIIEAHQAEQPLEFLHMGGDEVSEKALMESPICEDILGNDRKDFMLKIMKKLVQIGTELGVRVVLWETNARDKNFSTSPKPVIHFWQPSQKRDEVLNDYIDAGFEVILSEADVLYLDQRHENSSYENGLLWAAPKTDEFDVFKYVPPNHCLNQSKNCAERSENVLGMQANLWGELTWNENLMEEQMFPRLLSFAERAWHEADWQKSGTIDREALVRDWSSFADALVQRELPFLDDLSINYRIPPPGARRLSPSEFKYNTLLPDLKVQMSTDGGLTWNEAKNVSGNVLLATVSHDLKRKSQIIRLDPYQAGEPTMVSTADFTGVSISSKVPDLSTGVARSGSPKFGSKLVCTTLLLLLFSVLRDFL